MDSPDPISPAPASSQWTAGKTLATGMPLLDVPLKVLLFANVLLAATVALLVFVVHRQSSVPAPIVFVLFIGSLAQGVLGIAALFFRETRKLGIVSVLVAPVAWFGAVIGALTSMGWGRPLRVRGRQVYPQLTIGTDWTDGARPGVAGLDEPTRRALEALWLHDAQKEHASVPAFARISWMLAAVGAPADLMAWSQRAALEEIEHAQRCFALAAGYGGRTHGVQPMPDLLLAGLDVRGDPLAVLAHESLHDGCQMEDFNADVAAASAQVCEEPVTRRVLEQIAREERSHAEFSWALLAWTLERNPVAVGAAIAQAERALDAVSRPRAAGPRHWAVVARADAAQLLRHGRLQDERLAQLWQSRLEHTRSRLRALLQSQPAARVA